MGYGDEIMVTGEVRLLQESDARPVAVVDLEGAVRQSPVWEGNPRISDRLSGAQRYVNCAGFRPYIAGKTETRWFYTDWRASRGELYWPRAHPGDYVIIEPQLKHSASVNKQWGRANWQALVKRMPDIRFVQMGRPGTEVLHGVTYAPTGSFKEAVMLLSGARACVLPEGGLHHAAEALGVPAVVLFGGMTSPLNTGYDDQVNLWVDDPDALGWRIPHPACRAAWQRITPAMVEDALKGIV